MEMSGQLHGPPPLPYLRYPLDRWLAGPRCRSRHCGEEKNLLTILGIEPRLVSSPAHTLIAVPTELPRPPYHVIVRLNEGSCGERIARGGGVIQINQTENLQYESFKERAYVRDQGSME
jgi:hypothetical protein